MCSNECAISFWNNFIWSPLINTAKHPWFSPCTWRNRVVRAPIRVPISKRYWFHSRAFTVKFFLLLWYSFVTPWCWLRLRCHWWRRQLPDRVHHTDLEWDLCTECMLRFTFNFLNYSIFYIIKGLWMVAYALWRSEALRFELWLRARENWYVGRRHATQLM